MWAEEFAARPTEAQAHLHITPICRQTHTHTREPVCLYTEQHAENALTYSLVITIKSNST